MKCRSSIKICKTYQSAGIPVCRRAQRLTQLPQVQFNPLTLAPTTLTLENTIFCEQQVHTALASRGEIREFDRARPLTAPTPTEFRTEPARQFNFDTVSLTSRQGHARTNY